MRALVHFMIASLLAALPSAHSARMAGAAVSWTGSAQGPYPVGNPSAQPDQEIRLP